MTHPRRTTAFAAITLAAAVVVGASGCAADPAEAPTAQATTVTTAPARDVDVSAELQALEGEFDARVGVSVLDTGTGDSVAYRSDERFGYASTLKLFAAAELLHDVPADQRDEIATWSAADMEEAGYSPVTSAHVDTGLPLAQLAEAAMRESDNTAMNVILERIGGPAGLDRALEELGDTTTEVVNREDELNRIEPGSTDDTTTPAAFTGALAGILRGDRLSDHDRAILLDWMSGNATGDALIRAGAPDGWTVADKSGGAGAIRDDIAVVTPPGRDPLVVTILTTRNDPERDHDDALVARAAEVVLAALA
ncbi:class A beta-lactamase [Clavibacter lycopersici]|uniref:Beta-lactamase n=1 Tax=Clavibacter lycopersici TaxID=2301718 RepID=A0A399T5W3_9MICO|nr:class A beta-lactamase [Clavibacter lycopersici]RIJ51686.1 class A beta-lactamase [Clavibacter lycopersici]RIJ61130.1 class A beta-lactamase [Clavibacter lycopersici]